MTLAFRILQVDLSSRESTWIIIPRETFRLFLGGASLGAYILLPTLHSELDPLGDDAPLLIITGPLTGTMGAAVGRCVICGKSPATGLWAESNIGGYFGSELRAAGIDALLLNGKAEEPIYLWICDGELEFRSADELWGKCDTYETQRFIRHEVQDSRVRVACIGTAGENQLRYALILCDHGRVAGRTGLGAVMGAKKLKAIAVRGSRPIQLANPDAFKQLRHDINISLRDDIVSRSIREMGTSSIADYMDYLGSMPKHYYTKGVFEGIHKVTGTTMSETILAGVSTCHGCVIACGRVVKLSDGKRRKGPEYETIAGFGSNLEIDDLEAITMLGECCDRHGMDVISVSNVIGLSFLLYERGFISEKDTGGLALRWGDVSIVSKLIDQMVSKEAFGALLALGAQSLAERFGAPELAAQINDLEMAYHDPRGLSGMALVYATSPRGACHNQSDYYMVEIGQTEEEVGIKYFDRHAGAEKAENVVRHQNWRTLRNALVLCIFANLSTQNLMRLVNEATGLDYSLEELVLVGERAWNLKRMINHRLGLKGDWDRLPGLFQHPLPDGGAAGYTIPFEEMLAAYYQARSWDPKTGMPSPDCLQRLQLGYLIQDL